MICLQLALSALLNYADDSKAYKIITHPSDRNLLQLSLDKLGIWAELCELARFTYNKCFYLQIGYKDELLSYKIYYRSTHFKTLS